MFEIILEPTQKKSYMLVNLLNNQKVKKFFKSEQEAEAYATYLLDTYSDDQLSSNWYLTQEDIREYKPRVQTKEVQRKRSTDAWKYFRKRRTLG